MGDSTTREQFLAAFPAIVKSLVESPALSQLPEMQKWVEKVLEYNLVGGKLNRGLAVVESFKVLTEEKESTENELQLAIILGWAVEILQAFFLVADDIMDGSFTRRNQPCWFRTNGLGVKAFNDSILLESAVYQILAAHFRDKPYYTAILDLFHDVTMKTSLGQAMDLLSAPSANEKPDLNLYTKEKYDSLVTYKTAYYSFYLPVALAMHMAGIDSREDLQTAESILLPMGHFFQVQDDFLDCFGDPEVTGKQGTDIEDGKCTWLIINALSKCNEEQKQLLKTCYGSNEPADVGNVKSVYTQLGIPELYAEYEETSFQDIRAKIENLNSRLPPKMFHAFASKIYKRKA